MDSLAEKIYMDPLEFRIKNALRKGDPQNGQLLENSVGPVECLEGTKKSWVEWRKAAEEHNQQSSGNLKRGVGSGSVWYGCGILQCLILYQIWVGINGQGESYLVQWGNGYWSGSKHSHGSNMCGCPWAFLHLSLIFLWEIQPLTGSRENLCFPRQTFVSGNPLSLGGKCLREKIIQLAEVSDQSSIQ
ncbi:MAG: hypothetical protein CM1200mP30_01740 [Pseudomonadota bacterium]|nr:MAG: hypothetical protein CM1200mP30_01740 [Pseudomonadota bacterium]